MVIMLAHHELVHMTAKKRSIENALGYPLDH